MIVRKRKGGNKMPLINGMAVLIIRILFVVISYFLLEKLDWHKIFTERHYRYAQYVCLFTSIALGHTVGSFVITIMETLQNILFALFL